MGLGNDSAGVLADLATHYGGGVLGSNTYLYLILAKQSKPLDLPDGGLLVHRGFAKSVMNDFLCREFPVVDKDDVSHFVAPESSLTFRQSASCNQCHASMDQLAGVVRNLTYEKRRAEGQELVDGQPRL